MATISKGSSHHSSPSSAVGGNAARQRADARATARGDPQAPTMPNPGLRDEVRPGASMVQPSTAACRGVRPGPRRSRRATAYCSSTIRPPRPAACPAISSIGPRQTAVHSRPKPSQTSDPASAGGSRPRLVEPERQPPVRRLDLVERAAEDDPAAVDHRHVVGHPLDLVEQVRREEDRPPLLGDRPDDRRQDLAADDRVEPRRRLVEHQQLGPVRQRRQQPDPRPLPLRQALDPRPRVEVELARAARRRTRRPSSG